MASAEPIRAALAEQQGEGPSHGDICQWLECLGHWGDNAHRIPRIANMVQDALARWGRPAPQPPAEGEVAKLVEDLRRICFDIAAWDADTITRAAELLQQQVVKIQELEQKLETERLRLAVCGVIAMSDTPESVARNRDCHPDYWSASADDIARQIDELMRLRAQQTPVPVEEEPWEREGWCDENGWCWFGCHGEVWMFCHPNEREISSVSLPAGALPVPLPQGEVK